MNGELNYFLESRVLPEIYRMQENVCEWRGSNCGTQWPTESIHNSVLRHGACWKSSLSHPFRGKPYENLAFSFKMD